MLVTRCILRAGRYTGDPNPPRVSSTGRDLFVKFTTDHGNAGVSS